MNGPEDGDRPSMRPSFRSIPAPPESRPAKVVASFIDRLAELQGKRPWLPLLIVGLISILGGWLATRLELRTRYDQLLPESQPSVVEMRTSSPSRRTMTRP